MVLEVWETKFGTVVLHSNVNELRTDLFFRASGKVKVAEKSQNKFVKLRLKNETKVFFQISMTNDHAKFLIFVSQISKTMVQSFGTKMFRPSTHDGASNFITRA